MALLSGASSDAKQSRHEQERIGHMHRGTQKTGWLLLGLLLLGACATSHGGHKAKLAHKKRQQQDDSSMGIYTPSSSNDKILRHGQHVMGSNALGSY